MRHMLGGISMEYRKLIKFGNNSYVVSLPKAWLEKNGLTKGASLYLEPNSQQLVLSAAPIEHRAEPRATTIDARGLDTNTFRRTLVAHYVNNFHTVRILIDGRSDVAQMRTIIHGLMALEILEQTTEHILAKDYVNLEEITVDSLIHKVDNIVRGMLADITKVVSESTFFENIELSDSIQARDVDVNRLMFLVKRTVKHRLGTTVPARGGDTPLDYLRAYELAMALEQGADEIKRIARLLVEIETHKYPKLVRLIQDINRYYLDSMKAYAKRNAEQAFAVSSQKGSYMTLTTELMMAYKDRPTLVNLIHHLRNLINSLHTITRVMYQ